jgi:hypothetical protein
MIAKDNMLSRYENIKSRVNHNCFTFHILCVLNHKITHEPVYYGKFQLYNWLDNGNCKVITYPNTLKILSPIRSKYLTCPALLAYCNPQPTNIVVCSFLSSLLCQAFLAFLSYYHSVIRCRIMTTALIIGGW